jgi:hypothetical protein
MERLSVGNLNLYMSMMSHYMGMLRTVIASFYLNAQVEIHSASYGLTRAVV